MIDLHSEKIPDVPKTADINDLFMFFGINFNTLGPALWLLFGTLFAFFVLAILKRQYED